MSFSIIQTIENGKYLISSVPHKWVSNNTLYWPTNKSTLDKLQKNGHSVPEIAWTTYPCIVKKTGVASYDEASQIEKEMLDWSYSESEPQISETHVEKKKKRANLADTSQKLCLSQMANFNDLFEINNMDLVVPSSPVLPLHQRKSPVIKSEAAVIQRSKITETINLVDYTQPNDDADPPAFHNNNLPSNITETEDNNAVISCDLPNLNELLNFDFSKFDQRLVKLEVGNSQMNAKLDQILEILKNGHQNQNICVSAPDILTSFPFPLTNVEQVEKLESKLLEDDFKKKIISELKRMNGSSGNLDGKKVSYKLIDWLFDRKLLTEYTWTGSSKNKTKNAFLALKQIVDMIFQIVNSADAKFNLHMVEEFLKINILKYSESRFQQIEPHERQSKRKTKLNIHKNLPNFEHVNKETLNNESSLCDEDL